jgi:hypothetical protein
MPDRRNHPATVKRAKRLRGEMTEAEKKCGVLHVISRELGIAV